MSTLTAPSLAPAEPLQHARKSQPTRKVSLVDFLVGQRDEMRKEKQGEVWQHRLSASQKNDLFYRGFQRLRKADMGNGWRPLDPKPIHFILNEFQFWVNVNVYKWNNSRVDYRVYGLNDSEDAEAAARKVEWIADYYDDRDWTRSEVILAAKEAMFTGYLVAYVYYDRNFSPRAAYVPVTERLEAQKMGADTYRCADCGTAGEAKEGVCGQCGSERLAVTQSPVISGEVETGQQEVYRGDVTHRLIPLYNLAWKARLGLKKSNVVLWEEEFDTAELEACYEGLELSSGKVDDAGLRAVSNLENIGRGDSEKAKKTVLTRIWLEPSAYKAVELKEDVQTVTGTAFPAGTRLIEVFPQGCHAILVDDLIVDLYTAVKNDDLCVMEYNSVPHGLAEGVDAMCEPQRNMNTANSLKNLWLRHLACPPSTYVKGLINPGDISGDLTKPIPIEAQNLALFPGISANQAWDIKQGQQIPAAVFTYTDNMRSAIQFAACATEFSEGLPSVDNSTLGGARIAQGLAQGIYGTYLAQWSDFRVEVIKRKLKKFKQHCWDERYFQFAGDYGLLEGETLSGMDVPDEFRIEPVPNSWLPRTPEQRQQNMQSLLMALGGIAGLATAPPALLAEMCEIYDIRYTENLFPVAIRTARMLIKQAQQLLPKLQMVQELTQSLMGMPPMQEGIDPLTGAPTVEPLNAGLAIFSAITPKFNPRWAGVGEMAEYLSKWLLTDDGLAAPQEIIDFVGVLQDACVEAVSMQQMVRGGVAMAGQPLPIEGQPPNENAEKPAQSSAAASVGG